MKKVLALSAILVALFMGASLAHAQTASTTSGASLGPSTGGQGYDMPIHLAYLHRELVADLQQLIAALQAEVRSAQGN